ncbi:hypothetical protein R3W88_013320 [Solanum pinnatisectum]|uniref:Uncharacterized protein n=1 Tax=Solanum pinnatisectum TaxID=50273 RepID=A0AAV9LFD9_9SOLN|nr:hypothetical protein R3W88_013320 [Solanum pinnatisectum]
MLYYFVYFVLIFTIRSCEGKMQLPKNFVVKAIFTFGDSIVDQGNNNYISTMAKCNFLPYGKDFNGGIPTGRFSNGKTPPDLLDFKTGVSFASGGCGFDPLTSIIAFKEYTGKLERLVGEEEATYILKNSLFLVVVGSDDLANTYFTLGSRLKHDINSYTDLMVAKATEFLQLVGYIQCVLKNTMKMANTKFSTEIDSLSKKLAQSKLVFIDIYNTFLDLIVNPKKYGCCGTGTIEAIILCNEFSGICEDDTKYLFWNSYHPTEKGYKILVNEILKKYTNNFL